MVLEPSERVVAVAKLAEKDEDLINTIDLLDCDSDEEFDDDEE
jgi:hypothetical protein